MISFQLCTHENLEIGKTKTCSDCRGQWDLDGELLSKYPGCDCSNCPFKSDSFVPPDGPPDAEALFVGMTPAYYEVRQGRPFAGPSGNLFDGALEYANMHRSDVGADNATLCSGVKPRQGDPPSTAINACRGHILEAMESAKIVVPMGNAALRSVTGRLETSGIMSLAGTTFRQDDKIVMPLVHPSFYLPSSDGSRPQSPDMFKDYLDSMELLSYILRTNSLPSDTTVTTKVFTDARECIDWLDNLEDQEVMAVDLETDYPDPIRAVITCVSLAYNEHEAFVIPWNAEYLESHGSDYEPLMEYQEVYDALKRCLERQTGLIAHNAPFDARLLLREEIWLKIKHDTLLMHYALDERAIGQGLKRICRFMLGIPDWEGNLTRYLKRKDDPYTNIPPHILFPYAGEDGCRTVTLKRVLQEMLDKEGNEGPKRLYEGMLTRMNNMLIDISLEGVGMDAQALMKALEEMPKKLWELEKELEGLTGDRFFNPSSPQQISKFMFETLEIPKVKGNSTDASVLDYLVGDLDEDDDIDELPLERKFPAKLKEFRQYKKVSGTYIENFAREYLRGKGYPDLRLFGTVGGRLTASKFNPLVFPRESRGGIYRVVKSIIIPDTPEEAIWVVDCKGMELRILAYLAADPWLKQQMNDRGVDIHAIMAQEIFGDEFRYADEYKRKELRVIAKMLVFGLNYGRGAPSIARQLKCSIVEAQSLVNRYFAPMPQVYQWRENIKRQAIEDEYLETLFGRRRRFNLITSQNKADIERQALNIPVQSTANDVNFEVMLELRDRLHPIVKPKFPVHDSIVQSNRLDMTVEQVQEALDIFSEIPKKVLPDCNDLEFHWDVSIGANWGHTTDCKTVEDIMNKMSELREVIPA